MDNLNQPIQTPPPPPVQPPPIQPPPVEQTPPPPPQTRSFLSKPLIILLIALFLFAIFYAGTYFKLNQTLTNIISPPKPTPTITSTPSPTQAIDPTANWKTYTNTKEGFSLSYPLNTIEGSRDPDPFPVARQFQFSKLRGRGGGGPLTVGWLIIVSEIQPNPNNLTLREWGKEKEIIYSKGNTIDPKYISITDTTLGGLPTLSWKSAGGDGNIKYYLVKRTNGITLVVTNVDLGYQQIVDQILSTFKFTNQ